MCWWTKLDRYLRTDCVVKSFFFLTIDKTRYTGKRRLDVRIFMTVELQLRIKMGAYNYSQNKAIALSSFQGFSKEIPNAYLQIRSQISINHFNFPTMWEFNVVSWMLIIIRIRINGLFGKDLFEGCVYVTWWPK